MFKKIKKVSITGSAIQWVYLLANVQKDEKISITRSAIEWDYWKMFKKTSKSSLHAPTVKKVSCFPFPSRDATNQTLPGRE
jgi:hypothetical protein